jgi:hypothetical protein
MPAQGKNTIPMSDCIFASVTLQTLLWQLSPGIPVSTNLELIELSSINKVSLV